MSSRPKIDSVYDFTDKALVELKAWLEPWFTPAAAAAGSGSGGGETVQGTYAGSLDLDGGTSGAVSWTVGDGDEVLDLTDPDNPTVPEAGLYAVQITVTWGSE